MLQEMKTYFEKNFFFTKMDPSDVPAADLEASRPPPGGDGEEEEGPLGFSDPQPQSTMMPTTVLFRLEYRSRTEFLAWCSQDLRSSSRKPWVRNTSQVSPPTPTPTRDFLATEATSPRQ